MSPEEKEKLITKILRLYLSQKGSVWNRRIPTLFSLFLLLGGLSTAIFLNQRIQGMRIKAKSSFQPEEIKITNLSPSSFTVSWITREKTSGFISFGETASLGKVVLDDRDKEREEIGDYFTHHITLSHLRPATRYYFKIGSGGRLFGKGEEPLTAKTPQKTNHPPVFDPAFGRVLDKQGAPAEGAIVYLFLPDCTPLSALVKPSGGWLIPKNLSLKADFSSFCRYPKKGGEYRILIRGGEKGETHIDLLTGLDQPVPEIALGQDYSFKDLSRLRPLSPPPPTPTPSPPTGDLNNDGVINSQDVAILKSKLGGTDKEGDLNGDGRVDEKDLDILLANLRI